MVRRSSSTRVSMLFVALMLLAACGASPQPAAPASDAPTAAEAPPSTAAPADAPTAAEVPPSPAAADPTLAAEPASEPAAETTEATGAAPIKGEEGEENPFGDGSVQGDAAAATSGEYVADLGFRPENDGFGFPNYGNESGAAGMNAEDVWRMFGDQVCAGFDGDQCVLTPAGEQWVQQINDAMGGGHCEGMAVLSNLFYIGQASPLDFGAETVPELQIEDNEALQREIAYWWATQATQPARAGIVEQTPSGVVNTLLNAFAAGPEGSEQYAVGIYKRDRTGGHAVTPYAVEDRGDGIYWIMVYDNNYPATPRAIEVDTNSDTWQYEAAINPSVEADLYEGDAETFTLELAPIPPRLDQQICPFCDVEEAVGRGGAGLAQGEQVQYNEIWLDGEADLLITDAEGRNVGWLDGQFVNEIPGATSNANKFGVNVWDADAEPVYYMPTDTDFTITIDGSRLTEATDSTVTMIGPGYVLEVSDIVLEPGQVDILDVTPDGSFLSYRTASSETPLMLVGMETDAADYMFAVYGEDLAPGEALNLSLNTEENWLSLDSIDNAESGSYALAVIKYDDQGEQIFGAEGLVLEPDDVLYVDYLAWPGNGEPMELDVDYGGDGTLDEVLQIDDVTDAFAEE